VTKASGSPNNCMWPNAFGGTGLCRNSNQSGSPQNGNRKRRAETGGGRSIGGNRERYVESLSCGVFLQRNSSRAHTKLSVTMILPPDGRQRVRRIFYFKRHLPTRNLDDFQMGIGCWPLGIVYWMRTSGENFTVPETSLTAKSTVSPLSSARVTPIHC